MIFHAPLLVIDFFVFLFGDVSWKIDGSVYDNYARSLII